MKYTRYHTRSGSIYDVKDVDGKTFVRRTRLGAKHAERGHAQLAKRAADPIGASWSQAIAVEYRGSYLALQLRAGERGTLYTSPIDRVEQMEES